MKKITCFIFIIFTAWAGHTQDKRIDSLKLLIQKEKKDTAKIHKLVLLGEVYRRMKNDSALVFFQDAMRLSEKIGFIQGEIQARSSIAYFLLSVKSDYAKALDLYFRNLKMEELTGDTVYIFSDIQAVASIYERIEDFEKALEYINKLRNLISSGIIKSSAKLAKYNVTVDDRFGVIYQRMNKLDSAKYYKTRVFNDGIAKNEGGKIAIGSIGLGRIYRKLKKPDSAFYYYRTGMSVSKSHPNNDIYTELLIGLGNLHWESNQTDSAFYYAHKAFQFSQQGKNPGNMMNAAELLAEIFYEKKQPDSAYQYLKQSMLLKDSLFSSEKVNKVQSLSLNELLQKQQQEQTKKEAVQQYKSRIKIYSLAAGLTGLLILIFILYRNNRQRYFANRKIEKAYTDLKSTQTQLIQSEKMASLGELTAGIAHEIQNPLNFVNNFSEVNKELIAEMRDEINKGNIEEVKAIANDISENEEKINHHGKRADAIVKGMLQHSRASTGKKEPTNINALADEYLRLSYHGLRAKDKSFNATFETHLDESLGKVNVIPQDIGRVLLNLFTNAFYAVSEKKKLQGDNYEPTVSVSTKRIGNKTDSYRVEISVKDNGLGIPQKVLDKIFQPFFTTKPTGQGTGLGLSMSYDIVKAHGGELKVADKEIDGAEFIIVLPIN
jgi:signal transduction histidine kinase